MLEKWDGKSVEDLKELYEKGFVDKERCLEILSTDHLLAIQGSVWLLKFMLEKGTEFDKLETNKLLETFQRYDSWDIRMNILQSLKFLTLEMTIFVDLYDEIIECNKSENKFLRAWSYEGLYRLSLLDEKYEGTFEEKVNEGFQRESGAVLARIRQILKEREKHAKRASKP